MIHMMLVISFLMSQVDVAVVGHSFARYEEGFGQQQFPDLSSWYDGQDGLTCAGMIQNNFVLGMVPPSSRSAVIIIATNDLVQGVLPSDHAKCLKKVVSILWGRSPDLKIVLANTPPMAFNNCAGDYRAQITAYNLAYSQFVSGLNDPRLTLLDEWTPNTMPFNGWAWPGAMTGFCGVHPGPALQWAGGWPSYWSPPLEKAVWSALQ